MKVLILGGSGMLGHKLLQCLRDKFDLRTTLRQNKRKFEIYKLIEPGSIVGLADVRETKKVETIVTEFNPDVIINAIGIIKQHHAIDDDALVREINSEMPHQLADIAARSGSRLICISTDCVFSGTKGNYSETDLPDAADLYGRSKLAGEVLGKNCLTIRTSIIGRELAGRAGLLEWFFGNEGKLVRGYQNAIFSGFPTIVLADILSDIIEKHQALEGLYHIASQPIDKYELLLLIKKEFNLKIDVEPYREFKIDRSLNGEKFTRRTGFQPKSWPEMIKKMTRDPFPYHNFRK